MNENQEKFMLRIIIMRIFLAELNLKYKYIIFIRYIIINWSMMIWFIHP